MENKEAILMPFNEVVTGQWDWATTEALKQYTDMQRQASYREGIFKGYSKALYDLSSQTEELIKENEGLNRVTSKLFADKVEETRQLQSKIEELEKAFENNKEQLMELATHARDLESIIDELKKEIERLKGLIEDAHNSGWRRGYSLHTEIGESLQQFKTDNNL